MENHDGTSKVMITGASKGTGRAFAVQFLRSGVDWYLTRREIRLENLNDCFEESMKEFLQENIQINKLQNTGDKKAYSVIYKKFKKQIEIPSWYIDKLLSIPIIFIPRLKYPSLEIDGIED